ncbi:hypothetical protein [Cellulomonas denverensis]|uniref:Lipoprotein n=1 Tax=Cellulomonas denverensis TaxID=264297 RepID=A0A7X6KU95_9CELL|nr:hypothetical protein [Cellulomonas denverensis]NKY22431.1 hypothetical protein [Cellulomonas denverensis]GIG25904.1 hypothetical protein Cde04nite_21480 [Cellulomonas denverensis]
MRTRSLLPVAAVCGLALALTGCGGDDDPQPRDRATTEAAADPETTRPVAPSPSPLPEETPVSADPGDRVQPGQVVENGEWITYDWVGYDDSRAVLQTRLTGVTPASEAEMAEIVAENPDFAGYQVIWVTWETRKVSGDDIEYDSNGSDFTPATTEGTASQSAWSIGGSCNSGLFDEEFDQGTGVSEGCAMGIEVQGGQQVGGLLYTGPAAQDDNPFDEYHGSPVFLKG